MTNLADEMRIIDADTHLTEAHDLWTKRAPKGYEDRVPRVEVIDGRDTWLIDGKPFGFAGGGGIIDRDGNKHAVVEAMFDWGHDRVHLGAFDPEARLKVMDECGITAQVCYPNSIGLGGQGLTRENIDPVLRQVCIEIYNDACAEVQEWSNLRLLPMPAMPAWSVEASVREAERCADMGLRGINMTSDPHEAGGPDLADPVWDPFWEVCAARELPVHFHIGANISSGAFFGTHFWPSQDEYLKPAIGGIMLILSNVRILVNTIYAGIFDRHPNLQMVSVESGVGWIPFVLDAMDWEMAESAPGHAKFLERKPSEYFFDHWTATLWFENFQGNLPLLVDIIGEDRIMFETDFPHPTCIYPNPVDAVTEKITELGPVAARKIMGENAAKLYKI